MAGQTVVQSGYRLDIGGLETLTPFWEGRVDWCVPQRDSGRRTEKGRIIYEDVPGAEPVLISDAATEILGLTGYEKDVFFAGENTIPTLKRWANLFADVRDLPVLFPEESLADRDLIYYE